MVTHSVKRFGVRELRNDTLAVKRAVEADGEAILTHHGKPYAVVRPYEETSSLDGFFEWLNTIEPHDSGLAEVLLDERRQQEAEQVDRDPWA